MWNRLPDNMVLCPTPNSFKGRIDHHWKSLWYSVFFCVCWWSNLIEVTWIV